MNLFFYIRPDRDPSNHHKHDSPSDRSHNSSQHRVRADSMLLDCFCLVLLPAPTKAPR